MEIKTLKIGDIHPYEKNPRKNDKSVAAVARSIEEFGWQQPIVVDINHEIICGHTRYKAAKKLGMKEVPCVIAENLTEEQIKAYRLADNKVSESSEWDLPLLSEELADIIDIDMSEFGFSFEEPEPDEVIEDEVPAVPKEPVSKRGQIYKLGDHRLMCGDSTSEADINALLDGENADVLFTDPPYGYQYQSNQRAKSDKFEVITNDDKILDFFTPTDGKISGFVFVCTTWKVLDKWIPLFKEHYPLTNMIIWDKGGGGMGDLEHTFSTDYEIILCSNNGALISKKRLGSVWSVAKDATSTYVHPTQKPVGISAMAIENVSKSGDSVLDLFGGSGSTLMACEQLKRRAYMMEYEPKWIDVIIKRWEDFTGRKAVLLNG